MLKFSKYKLLVYIFIVATLAGPVYVLIINYPKLNLHWRDAIHKSARIAPDPKKHTEAIIQAYKARAFNWRGFFSVHTWLAVKPVNAEKYTIIQVIGWRAMRGLPPLAISKDVPDRYWFSSKPSIIYDLRGDKAERLIPEILKKIKKYPFAYYRFWPGPNSNTLLAWIGRHVPDLEITVPSNAIGKDFVPISQFFSPAPSNTGYQLSLWGILGITLARKEGFEINLLGLVYGVSLQQSIIKWPGIGDINY